MIAVTTGCFTTFETITNFFHLKIAWNLKRIMLEMLWCTKINKWKPLNPTVHWATWEPNCLLLLQYCWDSIWWNCWTVIYSCLLSFWIVYTHQTQSNAKNHPVKEFNWKETINRHRWAKRMNRRSRSFINHNARQ